MCCFFWLFQPQWCQSPVNGYRLVKGLPEGEAVNGRKKSPTRDGTVHRLGWNFLWTQFKPTDWGSNRNWWLQSKAWSKARWNNHRCKAVRIREKQPTTARQKKGTYTVFFHPFFSPMRYCMCFLLLPYCREKLDTYRKNWTIASCRIHVIIVCADQLYVKSAAPFLYRGRYGFDRDRSSSGCEPGGRPRKNATPKNNWQI